MHKPIPFFELQVTINHLWEEQCFLLTSGSYPAHRYNTMTVGWGSLGVMWGKPFAMVVVRPTRYTFEFMEKYDTFTLCAFPKANRQAVQYLGSTSGRDKDKIALSGLKVTPSSVVEAPSFEEAELCIECRKVYWHDLEPAHFLKPELEANYPKKDYHRVYYGEVVAAFGEDKYRAR